MAATRVHFATNREEILAPDGTVTGFGPGLNQKSPLWLRYGEAEMEPGRRGGNPYAIASLSVAPENIPITPEEAKGEQVLRGSDAVFAALRARLVATDADLVMMLHGYACDFDNALSNAAEIRNAYGTKSCPVETAMFAWPADGRIVPWISYASDRDDARSSAKAIARALQRFLAYLGAIQEQAKAQAKRREKPDPPLCREDPPRRALDGLLRAAPGAAGADLRPWRAKAAARARQHLPDGRG